MEMFSVINKKDKWSRTASIERSMFEVNHSGNKIKKDRHTCRKERHRDFKAGRKYYT